MKERSGGKKPAKTGSALLSRAKSQQPARKNPEVGLAVLRV